MTAPIPFSPFADRKNRADTSAADKTGSFLDTPNPSAMTESNPASIHAHMTREERSTNQRTAAAPLPNTARRTPSKPPCAAPRRKSRKKPKNRSTAARYAHGTKFEVGKKRTSSAPETNPAPTTVPTSTSAFLTVPPARDSNVFIRLFYARTKAYFRKKTNFTDFSYK